MITLKQLANIMDLSPSTVSKSLNDSSEISSKTKARVRKYARAHRYVPNKVAQSLKSKQTKNIGVIIPNIRDEFFGMVLHGIETEARKKGYTIVVCISNDIHRYEERSLNTLINGSVDGLLISMAKETQIKKQYDHIDRARIQNCPIVMFDRVVDELSIDKVTIDDFESGYKAANHLLQTGCRKVAFLTTISKTSVSESRKAGYIKALKEYAEVYMAPIEIVIDNYDEFANILRSAINEHGLDGILAADELSAICTINIAQSFGKKVPQDLSVIGFTDGQASKFSNPPLTTVSQHAEEIGKHALRKLINRINNGDKYQNSRNRTITTKLVIRDSTRPLIVANA